MLTLTSLLFSFAVGEFTPIDTRAAVAERVRALCPAAAALPRDALRAREEWLATGAGSLPRALPGRAYPLQDWVALGCLRAMLSLVEPPAAPRWGMVPREPWANQAIDALVDGLNVRPADSLGAELLAAVAIDATEAPAHAAPALYEDIALTLHRTVLAGVRSPAVLRGCVAFELMVADTAAARYCSHIAMRAGADTTWHQLRWARVDLRHGDSAAASARLAAAIAAATTDAARGELAAALGDRFAGASLGDLANTAADGVLVTSCAPAPDPVACRARDNMRGMTGVRMESALYRLWDPRTLRPIGLVTYGLRRIDLLEAVGYDTNGFQPPRLGEPRADIYVRQWDSGNLQLTGRLATIEIPGREIDRGHATGFLFVTSSEAVTSWSMTVTTFVGRRGHSGGDHLLPLDTGGLAVSDPVFGAARDSVTWTIRDKAVVLAPLNALYRDETVHLYYQVLSAERREKLVTNLVFRRADDAPAEPALQIRIETPARVGLTEVQRELDVSRLAAGTYRLMIEVEDPASGERSRQERTLVVR